MKKLYKAILLLFAVLIVWMSIFTVEYTVREATHNHFEEKREGETNTDNIRDTYTSVLRPTDVEKYEDWSKYVEILEGDTIEVKVIKSN